ncbi:hypothetical protein PSN45_000844 [Yamadazyma tenuis]|uniref:Zinc finger C3HC4 RING-type domain-containing protein n=1 Tax=Candida tenuis (strain ATCC 10573 / BCRC 21748 / CBS 615 / JCM 9827 / NBRC 10315 / NRRL Y-1498 / VKM Y-70) TaxID=590646 RepID=G3BB26_CANTC|nr:uncharacterized protein CANTEDRAFT_136061 [Yamadazyma tenuis ATCC 10573]EGV62126.1 hypothetical protein CANTEDRAFT_136061 [Yamadazyma tenuis ATCC 10573]WEJ93381.1 hypothetical protein PSN45_000844 [Yamadazyma tenuis]
MNRDTSHKPDLGSHKEHHPKRQIPGPQAPDANEVIELDSDDESDTTGSSPVMSLNESHGLGNTNVTGNSSNSESADIVTVVDADADDDDVVITSVVPANSQLRGTRPHPDDEFNRIVRQRPDRRPTPTSVGVAPGGDDDVQILEERSVITAGPRLWFTMLNGPLTESETASSSDDDFNSPAEWGSLPPRHMNNTSDDADYRRVLVRRIASQGDRVFHRFHQAIQDNNVDGPARRILQSLFEHTTPDGIELGDHFFPMGVLGSNDIERSVMDRIERDNEREMDRKIETENTFNRKALLEKRSQIKREVQGYTSDITSNMIIGCELCGVTLGEGIPAEFKTNLEYNKKLAQLSIEYGVSAPWFCFKQLTEVDKDLSRRVFLSKCGHSFCGMCIKNIGNRPRATKKNSKQDITIDNPRIYAPAKCPSFGCEHKFRGKKSFIELYF